MKTPITLTCLVLLVTTLLAGCKKKDDPVAPTPPAVNEEEVITTLVITFTDQENSSEVFELRYADVDGVGGIRLSPLEMPCRTTGPSTLHCRC